MAIPTSQANPTPCSEAEMVIGVIRITAHPPSVLMSWAQEEIPLSLVEGTVELTRSVVEASWRGCGIYKLMMAYAVIALARSGKVTQLVGAIEPDFPAWKFLQTLGFQEVGEPKKYLPPPSNRIYYGRIVGCELSGELIEAAQGALAAQVSSVLERQLCCDVVFEGQISSSPIRLESYRQLKLSTRLKLSIRTSFCEALDAIRRQGYAEGEAWHATHDEFDETSHFVVASLLVGT